MAEFNILFLIASSLRPRLRFLSRASNSRGSLVDWVGVLSTLAIYWERQMGKVEKTDDALPIWTQFLNDASVRRLPRPAKAMLQAAQARLEEQLHDKDTGLAYLAEANQRGHALARSILRSNALGGELPTYPVAVHIDYDGEVKQFCAAVARTVQSVKWAFQPRAHSLFGVFVADLVFAHEYFSHLAPQDPHLPQFVTEGWLLAALLEEFRETEPFAEEARCQWMLWQKFRDALFDALQTTVPGLHRDRTGLRRADSLASSLYFYSAPTFWKLTRAIMSLPPGNENVVMLAELFGHLFELRNRLTKQILRERWQDLPDLLARARSATKLE